MGRKRTHLNLTSAERAELNRLLGTVDDTRTKERLHFALRAASGKHTLEDLARIVGRSRSTIQNWLSKFGAGGLPGLLERDTAPGKVSPLAQAKIQRQLRAGVKSGRFGTAAQVAAWLKDVHGIKLARKSIYYWLRKNDTKP